MKGQEKPNERKAERYHGHEPTIDNSNTFVTF